MKKDVKRFVRELVSQGFTVRLTRKNHWQVSADGLVIAVLPGTPSDWRSMRNSLAALRRAGFNHGRVGR